MKTFKNFLQEATTTEAIQQQCQSFLEESKGLPLYRGYGGTLAKFSFSSFKTVAVRKDRPPRDSSLYVHGLLDAYFQKKFGVKVRSEGLFTTGDLQTALKYGNANFVFPVGKFKFVWGTYKSDPVADTLHWTHQIDDMMRSRRAAEADNVTELVMNEIDWHTDDLPKAIRSGAEIAILTDNVILVPVKDVPYEKVIGG